MTRDYLLCEKVRCNLVCIRWMSMLGIDWPLRELKWERWMKAKCAPETWTFLLSLSVQQAHANVVLSQEVLDYAPLFAEIADAYFELEMYAEARPIYELLGTDAAVCPLMRLFLSHIESLISTIRRAVYIFSSRPPHASVCWESCGKLQRSMNMVSQMLNPAVTK